VVLFVFTVGLLNLGLGFAVAVALTEPPPWNQLKTKWLGKLPNLAIPWPQRWPMRLPIRLPAQLVSRLPTRLAGKKSAPALSRNPKHDVAPPVDDVDPLPPKPPGYKLEELPRRWLETLNAEGITPGSFLEAASHVMRLEVGQYREQLIAAESRVRSALAAADEGALRQVCDDLVQVNREWLARQSEAADVLKRGAGGHGDHERAAADLEQSLHDQAAMIKQCEATIAALHFRTELDTGCKRAFERLFQLLDQAHALRDRLNDLLATLLRESGGLAALNPKLQQDQGTGLANRIGVELVFHEWWQGDPQRGRQLTAAIIDIDRFVRVNQRLGTRVGDHTIAALARLLAESFRRERGHDRIIRLAGQSFLVFLGDTGPHQGLTAIERARQTIEATTWDDHGSEFDLTITAGVSEVRVEDSLTELLRRLGETLKFAKLAGRNRAALDEGDGPRLLDPPQFSVRGRVIPVLEEA